MIYMNKQEFVKEFEAMRDMAELRALSNHSLTQKLTEEQYLRIVELRKKIIDPLVEEKNESI